MQEAEEGLCFQASVAVFGSQEQICQVTTLG